MPLEIREAFPEDALRVAEIERLAYATDPLTPILFPGPFSPDAEVIRAKQISAQLAADSSTRWAKVVDTETGEMIAFSNWNVYKPGEPIPTRTRRTFNDPPCNIPACEEFWGDMYELREKHIPSSPHVCMPSFVLLIL